MPGNGEFHGCPFRHFDTTPLKRYLQSQWRLPCKQDQGVCIRTFASFNYFFTTFPCALPLYGIHEHSRNHKLRYSRHPRVHSVPAFHMFFRVSGFDGFYRPTQRIASISTSMSPIIQVDASGEPGRWSR